MVAIDLKAPIKLTKREVQRAEVSHTVDGPVYFTLISRVHMSGGNIVAVINIDTGYEYMVRAMLSSPNEDHEAVASAMIRLAREA